MIFEVFSKLEEKIQQTIDTVLLLQMELKELKEKNDSNEKEMNLILSEKVKIEEENKKLKEERDIWKDMLHGLLKKMNEI
ncbi:septal ring assembly protein ZapB [Buchnera aphidicola (Schlechtendalia chinensis)]|uniref:Septal ring assembly protein ZapB n=2 Tax=Buchnera aphidicola TaxID=9 RepID=A0A172WEA5_BUCSC|nr:cell division protein ZapB [Buchnera aphidicola]AAC31218.1 unknown [Buchnera aphidicola]ANF17272.1 septal ring assembly protein ZapB [Buchnera aphidicola (Schlechtendalia chinensis)]